MPASTAFRRCLVDMDIDGMMTLSRSVNPHHEIGDRKLVEATMHLARAQAESMPLKLQQYSIRWLRERGYGGTLLGVGVMIPTKHYVNGARLDD